jgi:hypothetical protein
MNQFVNVCHEIIIFIMLKDKWDLLFVYNICESLMILNKYCEIILI